MACFHRLGVAIPLNALMLDIGGRNILSGFLAALTSLETVFFSMATFGGSIFVISTIIQFLGGGDADSVDGALADGDTGSDGGEPGFKVFSIQSIGAFSLVSGSTGLALSKDLGLPEGVSVMAAIGAGGAILWFMSLIFKTFLRFSSNGALDYSQALLEEGDVYLTVPADGTGLIQLNIQGRLVTASARTLDGQSIPTGSRVVVREIDQDDTLVVVPLADDQDSEHLDSGSTETLSESESVVSSEQPNSSQRASVGVGG